MLNQANPPFQKKAQLWGEKYVIRHLKENNLRYNLNVYKLVQNLIKIITPLVHFEGHPQRL